MWFFFILLNKTSLFLLVYVLSLDCMSKKVVISEDVALEEVTRLLKRNDFKLVTINDKQTYDKTQRRHQRVFKLLARSKCMYTNFGKLSSWKLDKILCQTCMVQFKRGGK